MDIMWRTILLSILYAFCVCVQSSAKKIKRVTVREIKQPVVMAEQEGGAVSPFTKRPDLSMNIELDTVRDSLSLVLRSNPVLLQPSARHENARLFAGTVYDWSGSVIGPCAITFSDDSRRAFSGLLSGGAAGGRPQTVSETDMEELAEKKGVHCGTRYREHGPASYRRDRAEHLFDIFKKKKRADTDIDSSPGKGKSGPDDDDDASETNEPPEELCFPETHYIYVGVATDCEFVKRLGSAKKAREYILKTYNEVSMMYQKTFNLAIGIVEIVMPEDEQCADPEYMLAQAPAWNGPCLPTDSLSPKLADFTKWRSSERKGDEAGLWHLLTGCPVEGSEVGLGWIDTLGVQSQTTHHRSLAGGTAVSTLDGPSLTQVVGHELGHNLGACHDCSWKCTCAGPACRDCCPCVSTRSSCDCQGQYWMNPTTNMASLNFSPCTRHQICAALRLRPNHVHSVQAALAKISGSAGAGGGGAVCGNGIKEDGEECDCGSAEECASDPCCTPQCTLRSGAECSDRHGGGCCEGCKIVRDRKKVCRPAKSFCDYEERCDGVSGECPGDRFRPDGTLCGDTAQDAAFNAKRHCASGICTSRDEQCRLAAARFQAAAFCPSRTRRSSCQLSCSVPSPSSPGTSECLQLASMLVDGTRCGERGHCRQGVCVERGIVSQRHLRTLALLALPLSALILLVLAFTNLKCAWLFCLPLI